MAKTITTTTTKDEDDRSNESDAEESKSGFSDRSSCLQKSKHYNNWVKDDSVKQIIVCKTLYEEELLKHGQNNSVAMDIQLIKGVLPDLFAVLKFLESNDDLLYNGIICHYFFKNLQIVESKHYEWWKRNSIAVRKLIDGRCASISNLIKRSLMGM